MGNRGILHNDENRIVRPWAHKAWVTCLLKFKSIKRSRPFSQGNYSELFFLDEATAFAAGHRPCASCQRARHLEFKHAWVRGNLPGKVPVSIDMKEVDKVVHAERAISGGGKRTYDAHLVDLPHGAIFEHEDVAYLVTAAGYLPWSFEGYGAPKFIDAASLVKVLTPQSTVRAFDAGFVPILHQSANR